MRLRLSKIIAFRLVVSSLLLSAALLIDLNAPNGFPVNPFVLLIAVTFGLSACYLATLRLAEKWPALVDLQFALDAVLVSAFIHVTGGITSYFSSLYVLPIIAASTVRARRGAVQVAGLSATLYTGIVFAQYLQVGVVPAGWWLPAAAGELPARGFAQYTVAINLSGMFGVALLAGSLANRLRSARAGLEDASFERADLRAFNDHLIDCLTSGILTADARFRILSFNRAASTITGIPAAEARDRDVRDVLQLPADLASDLGTLDRRTGRRAEVMFRTRAGAAFDLGLSVSTLQFPEGTSGFLFTFQNITDFKRLERESRRHQRLVAVGEMAAGIAHEIRNPLASMAGSIEILRQELPLSGEQAELMDIVLRESERLNRRIRLFLAYARPDRHAAARVDVAALVREAAQLLRNSVDARDDHVIDTDVPASPLWFECDDAELRQVLWSLGTNGLRAMPAGGHLRIRASRDDDSGGALTIAVADDGCGIPAQELDGLFQPFRRAFDHGAGLGLAIVHRIVTDHGGRVDVSSTVGAGTTVTVRLPAASAPLQPRILVVDDESSLRDMLRIVLRRDGYEVLVAADGRTAIDLLQRERVDLLLSDIRMTDVSGVDVLKTAKALNRDIVAFMMTAFASTDTAVEAMRLGAVDYLTKPFSMDELRLKVRRHLETRQLKQENVLLKRALNSRHEFSSIIGRSDAMLAVFRMIETVAQTGSTVLVTGESGTGKELVARAIHFNSLRRDHPFVALNCGAVPETLLESELFGHMRGAFTGADANKKGLLEVAERGTIFLDEIGEMNMTMQVKLLRVLQERRFRRLGGTEESQADIRVVAATNQDLGRLVAEGRFREDLYYRINVIPMHLPPLRDRREDIPLLAAHFLEKHAARAGKTVRSISQEANELLAAYAWPGNVRELENVVERCVALEQTPVVLAETLPANIRDASSSPLRASAGSPAPVHAREAWPELAEGFDLEARGEDFYRHYIALALDRANGVQVKAAEMLGMSFRSFRYYAKKLKLR